MKTVRLGMIGAGQIAALTSREFRRHPDCEIVAVADPSAERAAELAAAVGAKHVYGEAQALLARDDVNAVYIAVPNALHEAIAVEALGTGKHVLLDKPFAINAAAAENMAAAAQQNGLTLMIGMNQRFEAGVQRARQLCRAGRLGEIYHVKAYWRRRAGIPRLGSWFTSRAVAGGGALLDIGVHVLDVAMHVIGNFEPVSVSGAVFSRFGSRGLGEGGWGRSERVHDAFDVDDFATALIRLNGGAVISLEAAWALHQGRSNEHDVVLYGDDAGLAVYAGELFEAGEDGEYRLIQNPKAPPPDHPHCSRAVHFVNVLLGREAPLVHVGEALAVQRVLDAVYESAATSREVQL